MCVCVYVCVCVCGEGRCCVIWWGGPSIRRRSSSSSLNRSWNTSMAEGAKGRSEYCLYLHVASNSRLCYGCDDMQTRVSSSGLVSCCELLHNIPRYKLAASPSLSPSPSPKSSGLVSCCELLHNIPRYKLAASPSLSPSPSPNIWWKSANCLAHYTCTQHIVSTCTCIL